MMMHERTPTVFPTGSRVKRASESSDGGSPRRSSEVRKMSATSSSGNTPSKTDVGKRVKFTGQMDKKEKHGTLRYIGSPEFAPGIWCGVELDDPQGRNNGSVQGIRYFSCAANYGLFVPLGRVELDHTPRPAKVPRQIPDRTKKIKALMNKSSKGKEDPFFYHTFSGVPRASSIPSLNMIESSGRSSTLKSSNRQADWSPWQQDSSAHKFTDIPGIRINDSLSSSSSSSSLLNKRFISEANLSRKSKSTSGESPLISITNTPSPQRIFRKTLGSLSNETDIGSSSIGSSLRGSTSCNDLNQISNSPSPRRGVSHSVPCTPYDSEDCYSSASDLSRHNSISSDSDPTPHSSSASPEYNENAFILSPTHSTSIKLLSSPESSPARRIKSPGLSTLASNLIEVSRSNGAGEYRGPSPEGPGSQKKFQNTHGGGRTLEHPLVNGCSALKTRDSDEEKQTEGTISRHSNTRSPDEIFNQLESCLRQQSLTDSRVKSLEVSLNSFKSTLLSAMKEVEESFHKQVEELKSFHKKEVHELQSRHDKELMEMHSSYQSAIEKLRQEISHKRS
ncbi:PREDICTED: uncharacterized protein LOC100635819 [Amphimedon queenslandica]|uniref:CAP-Gly domain-containing protein n=1 Tax=Amphimedon queenslandica TaxID=400682 RepID=A0A1X7UTE7_AMPQE|nr:PREDICTED: uncharacterized protein LOC100635819 [Amphimedon queenslandica]|eukprot:XP_019852341.1 PREDICTED: uncharacterized protein LOC100635819 [Amphimedon queenslandica]